MTKQEFIDVVAKDVGATKADTRIFFDSFVDNIIKVIRAEDSIKFVGLGEFGVKTLPARTYRDPRNGNEIEKPERITPYFRFKKEFKDEIKHMSSFD